MKIEHAYILYIDTPKATSYMEECKASCEKYGIPVTPFLGLKLPTTSQHIKEKWGFNVDPQVDGHEFTDDVLNIWFREQLCLTGHLAIWKEIISKHSGAVAVFEHDAIVTRSFEDINVNDGEFTFLGYRVDHRDDYECISDPYVKIPVNKFEGTHAYAVTPGTVNACLNALENFQVQNKYLPLGISIDHMMGVRNMFNIAMNVVDPAPVIVPLENKESYTQPDNKTAHYNMIPHDGFLKGLKNTDKYKIDEKNGWIVF